MISLVSSLALLDACDTVQVDLLHVLHVEGSLQRRETALVRRLKRMIELLRAAGDDARKDMVKE